MHTYMHKNIIYRSIQFSIGSNVLLESSPTPTRKIKTCPYFYCLICFKFAWLKEAWLIQSYYGWRSFMLADLELAIPMEFKLDKGGRIGWRWMLNACGRPLRQRWWTEWLTSLPCMFTVPLLFSTCVGIGNIFYVLKFNFI